MLHACDVGNRCLIGMSAVILDKAVLQDDVFLAAGAVVPPGKVLESGYLYRGNPAKQARRLTDKEFEMLKYSAANYVKVKNSYMEPTT
jgi:carbonic anhydrase/acetyltransferase-like protein (isoleucine patch superfamily)